MKRILSILSIILLITIHSWGQPSRPAPTQDPELKIIKLYPNPAVSYITIDLQNETPQGYSIQIYNLLGKKLYEKQIVTQKTTVALDEFNRGVYIFHLRDQNSKVIESGKFQVSK